MDKTKWISLKDRMPEQLKGVLVTDGTDVWSAVWYALGKNIYWASHGCNGYDIENEFGDPAHWMPLPEPPKHG